mgnify:CR=1 FL=1
MTKTCSELFQGMDCTIIGNGNEEVAGLAFRSDEVRPNDMFFCIVGTVVDGHSFAQDAIDRGATSLVAERKVYLADATDVTEVVVSDSRKAMAYASANYYDNPSRAFSLVGITGTNGKTTTTYLVEHIASVAGNRCGVIGTVGNKIAGVMEHAERTTPESPDLQKLFARMRDAGCTVVAMEVSSHALDLRRTWDTDFAVTAFTNLTQDHLDYHHTFDDYFEAKALLFSRTTRPAASSPSTAPGGACFAPLHAAATRSSPRASTSPPRSIRWKSPTRPPAPRRCSRCAGRASRWSTRSWGAST